MSSSIFSVLAIGMPMGSEWLVIGLLGLLIFGKRLPDVGKAVGKTYKQFKDAMKGVEQEIADAVEAPTVHALLTEPESAPLVPPARKFDPYTGKPIGQTNQAVK